MVGFVIQVDCSILIEVPQNALLCCWIGHSRYTPDCVYQRGLGKVEITKGNVLIQPECLDLAMCIAGSLWITSAVISVPVVTIEVQVRATRCVVVLQFCPR